MSQEKYQHLFEWSIDAFDKEIQRFKRIDRKAAYYLSSLTLLAGITSFFIDAILGRLLPLSGGLEWTIAILTLLLIVLIGLSWWFVFSVLRVSSLRALPVNEELLNFYRQNSLIDIRFALSKKIASALQDNREETDRKACLLTKGYYCIVGTLICLTVLTGTFTVHRWQRANDKPKQESEKQSVMANPEGSNENEGGESAKPGEGDQNPDPGNPDPDVEAPDFPQMNEGYKPDSTRKRKQLNEDDGSKSEDNSDST